jgi:hypothetical protein
MACKWVRFAYRFLPLPAWRAFLLDRHIDGCPSCQSVALGDEAVHCLGVTAADLLNEPPLRPAISTAPPARPFKLSWRYAYGFFLTGALILIVAALLRMAPSANPAQGSVVVMDGEADSCVFAVLEARIGNEPARPVIFKPRQPGLTIVWFEKTKKMN